MPPEFFPTHHRSLRLQNFTAFGEATFEFVPGVNVLVGENGTGKTHALKLLYHFSQWLQSEVSRLLNFQRIFSLRSPQEAVRLLRFGRQQSVVWWSADHAQGNLTLSADGKDYAAHDREMPVGSRQEPVFLPAVDMIGHTKSYLALERGYELDFDQTFGDLVSKLELQTKYDPFNLAAAEMQTLQDRMGGTVEYDAGDRRFYLVTPQGRIAMPLVAEGLRKFATLHTVWKNGWLRPGTCLFWDEPEANLNPKLMDEAVAAILALARGGVQVFLATHSYVILKELELQAGPDDSVRFFALEKTDEGTKVHPADRYLDLKPNPIEEQYLRLYDLTLERAIRGPRR